MTDPDPKQGAVRAWLSHAFAVSAERDFTDEDRDLARRMAVFIVRRRMTAPATMALEAGRPVSFIGSQFLAFLRPFLGLVFSPDETTRFIELLERRDGVDLLLEEVSRQEAAADG